jgi:glutamate-1-semialdehyde 2,1-aminomutase
MSSASVLAIVQARMGSSRLPGKVLLPLGQTTVIGYLLQRLALSKEVGRIMLATSLEATDDTLAGHVARLGFTVFRGSEVDVLDRYYQAARPIAPDVVVRVTGDCPLIDPCLVDQVVRALIESGADYASNICPPSFPDGLDVEAFTFKALSRAWREANRADEREHVTLYLQQHPQIVRVNTRANKDHSSLRWTVDEPSDYELIRKIVGEFSGRCDFSWEEVLGLESSKPGLFSTNQQYVRNAGSAADGGQKLWSRAKKVIAGGNMLLSKRPEMFLPDYWPAYFSRASGCKVWDLDGQQFTDMSLMGIGTNTLGYGHPEVDEAVRQTIERGNMSTLNCPEEVLLAERLIQIHPWAGMVRLARTGGEANAVAIRIARAATGRDKVAICGYHGWHDWYLSANLSNDQSLDGHLLPGLDPAGVPRGLQGSVLPFSYNDFETLEKLSELHELAAIKMEVVRNLGPENDFLQRVRDLATRRGIVLVFDECTSGFRETFGGLHKKYGVDPDMAIFGKAMGNGYAITAVIGRREVMDAAQSTFISSTFWTERIGPVAALKTLEVMERERSWETITQVGHKLRKRWLDLAQIHGLRLEFSGLLALSSFAFSSIDNLIAKTFITQEMLKRKFLAGNTVYCSTAHTPTVLDEYFESLNPVFSAIANTPSTQELRDRLVGPICHAGFSRLN